MTIPDFQTVFLPLLQACADGREYRLSDVMEIITRHFKLTEEEINERLPSGKQTVIRNRTAWSCTYLKKAGLLESKRRGFFNITATGLEVLQQNHDRLNTRFLRQFAGFEAFYKSRKTESTTSDEPAADQTPDELMEEGYKQIRSNLAADLLDKLRSVDPLFFEHIVGKLLTNMGYGEYEITKRSGDKGIDAIVNQDQLGLDRIFVQPNVTPRTMRYPPTRSGTLSEPWTWKACKKAFFSPPPSSRKTRRISSPKHPKTSS